MSHPRFDAVMFDFGGIFIESPFGAVGEAAAELGFAPDVLAQLVFGSYDEDSQHPFHQLERGEISFDDAIAGIIQNAHEAGYPEFDPFAFFGKLAQSLRRPITEMVDVVREARAVGLRTSIVTNNIREFGSAWRATIDVEGLFDDVVDSSAVGVRKPGAAIFEMACERLGVTPDRVCFVDDHMGNVRGAQALGIHALCAGLTREEVVATASHLLELIRSR